MSDFHQSGVMTTLYQLDRSDLEAIDATLVAADEYLRNPLGIPLISNCKQLTSAVPDLFDLLKDPVNRDCSGR